MIKIHSNAFDNLDYNSHSIIHSYLERPDICALKYVSTSQNQNAHITLYSQFKKRVAKIFSNKITAEKLFSIVTCNLGIKPPKNCHEMEWLNSIIVDNQRELFSKARDFIFLCEASRYDSFITLPLNESNLHKFLDQDVTYGPYRANIIFEYEGEKSDYLLRNIANCLVNKKRIVSKNKTYIYTQIPTNFLSITTTNKGLNEYPKTKIDYTNPGDYFCTILFGDAKYKFKQCHDEHCRNIWDVIIVVCYTFLCIAGFGYGYKYLTRE